MKEILAWFCAILIFAGFFELWWSMAAQTYHRFLTKVSDMATENVKKKKPRVRFCWECGNKLRGNHFIEKEVEGHMRILHKSCAMNRDLKAIAAF
jgi:hypothetical protein